MNGDNVYVWIEWRTWRVGAGLEHGMLGLYLGPVNVVLRVGALWAKRPWYDR